MLAANSLALGVVKDPEVASDEVAEVEEVGGAEVVEEVDVVVEVVDDEVVELEEVEEVEVIGVEVAIAQRYRAAVVNEVVGIVGLFVETEVEEVVDVGEKPRLFELVHGDHSRNP